MSIGGLPALGSLLNPYTGFYNSAEKPTALPLPNEIALSDLKEEAHVYFDERRIPHIFAKNEQDLYYLQGYVVASLRLWQMEFQVLAAEGRVSELLGNDEKYINFDKQQRRLGMKYGAENKLKQINQEADKSQDIIEAFSKGVNAYIHNLKDKDLPIEYKLIGYKPEEWNTYKTALLLMNMSNVLTSTEYDIENTNFASQYGKELFEQLYPSYDSTIVPIMETPKEGWVNKLKEKDTLQQLNLPIAPAAAVSTQTSLNQLYDKPDVQIGSNNWAVSGKKTKSGYPLLSNDPHLRLTFPSVWVEMHLNSPGLNTYGVVFPGAPGIIIGFNDYIGWGVTNAGRDVKDWYEIEFKDNNKDFYKWENGWRETTKVVEEIKIKGAASVFDTIIFTHLGPVTYENFDTKSGKKNLALQWMAHKPSNELMAFYKLNRATNFEDYLNALRDYSCPAQNFIFADVSGDIAIRQQGKFPVLEKEEGVFIENGATREAWSKFIPFDEIPLMHNPTRDYVSSANQQIADTSYPYYYNGVFEYYRNRVINATLDTLQNATVESMKKLQFNNYNKMAEESLPLLMGYLNETQLNDESKAIFNALKNWDYYNEVDSKEAIYAQLFLEAYYTNLWDEFVEKEVIGGWDPFKWKDGWKAPNEFQTYVLLRDSIQHQFIDNKETTKEETTADIVLMSFDEMVKESEKLPENETWGEYKNTYIEHLAMLPAFSEHVITGGNYKIVNATGKYHGPSWRMILDFDKGKIKGYGVYPGGQSGNPGSKYYDNMVEEWKNGNYHDLINSQDESFYSSDNYLKVTFKTKN